MTLENRKALIQRAYDAGAWLVPIAAKAATKGKLSKQGKRPLLAWKDNRLPIDGLLGLADHHFAYVAATVGRLTIDCDNLDLETDLRELLAAHDVGFDFLPSGDAAHYSIHYDGDCENTEWFIGGEKGGEIRRSGLTIIYDLEATVEAMEYRQAPADGAETVLKAIGAIKPPKAFKSKTFAPDVPADAVERVVNAMAERLQRVPERTKNGGWRLGTNGSWSVEANGSYFSFEKNRGGGLPHFIMDVTGCDWHEACEERDRLVGPRKPVLQLIEARGEPDHEQGEQKSADELRDYMAMEPDPPTYEPPARPAIMPPATVWQLPSADRDRVMDVLDEIETTPGLAPKERKAIRDRAAAIVRDAEARKRVDDAEAAKTGTDPESVIPDNDLSLARCVANSPDPDTPRWCEERDGWAVRVPDINGVIFQPIDHKVAEHWIRRRQEAFYRRLDPLANLPDPISTVDADGETYMLLKPTTQGPWEHFRPLTARKDGMGQKLAAEIRIALESPTSPLVLWTGSPLVIGFPDGSCADLTQPTLGRRKATEEDAIIDPLPAAPAVHTGRGYLRRMIEHLSDGDKHTELFMQCHAAALMLPKSMGTCLWQLGPTRAGKSEYASLLLALGGERLAIAAHALFMGDKKGFDRNMRDANRARLKGRCGFIMAETADQRLSMMDEPMYKTILSSDPQVGRLMGGGNPVTYPGQLDGLVHTNKQVPPTSDPAVVERTAIMLVPPLPRQNRVPEIHKKIVNDELGAAVQWVLEGMHTIVQRGWRMPPISYAMQMLEDDWTAQSAKQTPEVAFVELCCARSPQAFTTTAALYDGYLRFCQANELSCPLSRELFFHAIAEMGFRAQKRYAGRGFWGIQLL